MDRKSVCDQMNTLLLKLLRILTLNDHFWETIVYYYELVQPNCAYNNTIGSLREVFVCGYLARLRKTKENLQKMDG